MENETHTLQDLEYSKKKKNKKTNYKTKKQLKMWKIKNAQCRTWNMARIL